MIVLKFGGTSVANAENIKKVIRIIKEYINAGKKLCIVVSAQSGITNKLIDLCDHVVQSKGEHETIISGIEQQHLNTIKDLIPVLNQSAVMAEVMNMCNELSSIVKGAFLVGEITPRTHDLILSFGERLSAYIITQALKIEISNATYVDARNIIRTDDHFGYAKVNFEETNQLIKKYFNNHQEVNVVTGFIASTKNGQTTTLGRSGSDYTASILGAALDAGVVEIWTDVDGMMTTDPRYVKEAKSIEQLSYSEAMELSHFGAKVIFPATMQPLMNKGIPIVIKNTFNPTHPGTLICSESGKTNDFIKGISSLKNISLITLEGSGMVGVAGISARMFTVLAQNQISVILITQASSEHSICIGISQHDRTKACSLLNKEFKAELEQNLISTIYAHDNLAIVAIVGENMRQMPGVSARFFTPLGKNGVNIRAISQGSTELNISIVIDEKDLQKALHVLHQSLFNYKYIQLHLYFAGFGAIGSKLIQMLEKQRQHLQTQKILISIHGMANSKHMLVSENNIDVNNWKNSPGILNCNMDEFTEKVISQNLENSIFIDVTASDEPVKYYTKLLNNNIAIVAANKRANTQSMKVYDELQEAAKKRNTAFNYETNVGAGLPVIHVIKSLINSGDQVQKIEAVLSGTMNYILSEYNGSSTFTSLVKHAHENGYTEPDPRDDLSGMDVARKCLILARECGWKMEEKDIEVEPLMPAYAAKAKDVDTFYKELKNHDDEFQKRFNNAKACGNKMRYVAHIENGKAKVSVLEVNEQHAFYGLKGTENAISITTNYYQQYPMLIKGPGAGVDVTAAGVLADIVRIAETLKK